MSEDLRSVVRQRGNQRPGAAACGTRTHVAQNAVHGISPACAPGEPVQLRDRTSGEVTGDRGVFRPGGWRGESHRR